MFGSILFVSIIIFNFLMVAAEIRQRRRIEGITKTLYGIILEFEIVGHGYEIDPTNWIKWDSEGWSNES